MKRLLVVITENEDGKDQVNFMEIKSMEEIQCYTLDAISDSSLHDTLLQSIKKYKKQNYLSAAVSLFFMPMVLFGLVMVFLFLFFISNVLLDGLKNSVNQFLSPLLSEAAIFLVDFVIYSIVEIALLSPLLILGIVLGAILYYSIKRATGKYPNVSDKLYLADNSEEVIKVTSGGFIHTRIINLFMDSLNKIGIRTDSMVKGIYAKGAVISKTSCEAMPFTALGIGVKIRLTVTKLNEYTLILAFTKSSSTTGSRPPFVMVLIKNIDCERLLNKLNETGGVEIVEVSLAKIKELLY